MWLRIGMDRRTGTRRGMQHVEERIVVVVAELCDTWSELTYYH
jgi:hypothetical protein